MSNIIPLPTYSALPPDVEDEFETVEANPEDAETSQKGRIRTKEQANRAIARIHYHRQELAKSEALAAAEQQRIDAASKRLADWLDDERQQREGPCRFWAGELERYYRGEVGYDRDRRIKTIKLPAGRLAAVKGQDRWDIDPAVLIPWAEANGREDLIRRPAPPAPQPDRNVVKRVLEFPEDGGQAVDPTSGQAIPGVFVTIGEERFSVETPELDQ